MTSPRASVVMVFLNAERFMAEAIDSVIAQTLQDWEFILVDDGSGDNSLAIAETYAARHRDRIRVLHHPGRINRGIAASRNLGMAQARGRYIAFLDADDIYEPERLGLHVRQLEASPGIAVVLSADLYWHSWQSGLASEQNRFDRIIRPAVTPRRVVKPPALIVATLLTAGAPMPCPGSVTFRRDAIRALGGIPEEFRGHYEDQVLLCKLLLSCAAITLDECLVRYRQHSQSLTEANAPHERIQGSPANLARGRFLEWLRAYAIEQGVELPDLTAWITSQLKALEDRAAYGQPGPETGMRVTVRQMATQWLPQRAWVGLFGMMHKVRGRFVRARVMRRIKSIERGRGVRRPDQADVGGDAQQDASIRAYWNERTDDTKLSEHPAGSAGFYAALDAYHLGKCGYLLQRVDFDGWAGREVLEIGCGAGLDLVRFARGGARVTGIDISSAALDLARGYCAVAGVPATLIEADGAQLPLSDASVDLVYCMGVLPFTRNPAAVVAEAYRVLRPGGQALFMVYNRRSWMTLMAALRGGHDGHADAPAFHLYDAKELDRLLARFPERRLLAERLPAASDRHRGIAGTIFDRGLVPLLRALPDKWLRPYGWHLLAYCRKTP